MYVVQPYQGGRGGMVVQFVTQSMITLLSCHFRNIATVSHFRLVFLKIEFLFYRNTFFMGMNGFEFKLNQENCISLLDLEEDILDIETQYNTFLEHRKGSK